MDQFFTDIYTTIFKKWILIQELDGYTRTLKQVHGNDVIMFDTDYCHGEVIFNDMNIIEMSVTALTTNDIVFYLHFQMNNLQHAVGLYHQLIDVIKAYISKPKINILLSCSVGLTTGYFAEKLNEANDLLDGDFHFSAVPIADVYEAAEDKAVVLLAPQIGFNRAKVAAALHDKTVMTIPAKIFACYDVTALIDLIKQTLAQNENDEPVKVTPLTIKKPAKHKTKILAISVIRFGLYVRIPYRVYDRHNQILDNQEILKYDWSINDIFDIISTALITNPDIKIVGISLPGIINNGRVTLPRENMFDFDIQSLIENKYPDIQVLIVNDVNAAAVGTYISQEQYDTLSFLFQPTNGAFAGIGSIYKGQLINGLNHLAGEAQFLPLALSNTIEELCKTPEGMEEIVAKIIVSIISILAPQAIYVSARFVTDQVQLKKHITHYIPEHYMPDLIFISDFNEQTILGTLLSAIYLTQ